MRSAAMRRVSSQVSERAAPAGTSFPLISTSGGLPGEKKRSLIFGEVLSIAANRAGVCMGAAAGAAAAAVRGAEEAGFVTGLVGEDIEVAQVGLCIALSLPPQGPEKVLGTEQI